MSTYLGENKETAVSDDCEYIGTGIFCLRHYRSYMFDNSFADESGDIVH